MSQSCRVRYGMTQAKSDMHVEKIMRAALSQMGSAVAVAEPPVTGAECKRWAVENTLVRIIIHPMGSPLYSSDSIPEAFLEIYPDVHIFADEC